MVLPGTNPFRVLCISFVGKSFIQLLCPSFSFKGQVQTLIRKGRKCRNKEGAKKKTRVWWESSVLVPFQGIDIAISFISSAASKTSSQIEDGKFRLRTRFLEHHPVISPPTNQKKVCTQLRIMKTDQLRKWWTSLSCFWNFHGWAESSELVFGNESTFSPVYWPPG